MKRFARGITTATYTLRLVIKSRTLGSLRFEFTSLARAHVDREEYVKLYERGQHQEHGVHGEAGATHRRVQLELIEPKRQVQQQQRRQQRYGRVLQPHRVYLHLLTL